VDDPRPTLFRIFNEVGIINQLANSELGRRLPDGVHPSQFALLGNLMRQGDGKTPADLAMAFQVPKASMTNTIMQLEKRGLIDVRRHAQDGRKKLVFLTVQGRALFIKTIGDMSGSKLAGAQDSVEGLDEILPVLEALRKWMDQNRS